MVRLFVHSAEFAALWKSAGLNDEELRELEIELCTNPSKGNVIAGACGLRKLRWRISGKGKRRSQSLICRFSEIFPAIPHNSDKEE